MRRQYIIFLTIIGSLLSYTAYKFHEALNISFGLVLPFMLPLFFIMFGGTLLARSNQLLNEKKWFQLFSSVGSLFIGFWGTFIIFAMTSDLLKILILGTYNIFQSEGLFYDSIIYFFQFKLPQNV